MSMLVWLMVETALAGECWLLPYYEVNETRTRTCPARVARDQMFRRCPAD
jgi:hypothetical protein